MSVILKTYHLKELRLMKRKVLRLHLYWAAVCLCMLAVVGFYRMENNLVAESYRTFKGEFQTLLAKQRLYTLLRSKALTVGQALDVADAVLGQDKVPVAIALGMMAVESEFNPNAASDHGARGLTQLMPTVWKHYASKFNPKHINDVSLNVKVGLTYLGDLHTEYKDWRMALRAYNAGPENARNKRYDPYANSVLRKAKEFDRTFEGV